MNRRSFLSSAGLILGAPAVVQAESLMKIWVPPADPGGHPFAILQEARQIILETAAIYEALQSRTIAIPTRRVSREQLEEMFPNQPNYQTTYRAQYRRPK